MLFCLKSAFVAISAIVNTLQFYQQDFQIIFQDIDLCESSTARPVSSTGGPSPRPGLPSLLIILFSLVCNYILPYHHLYVNRFFVIILEILYFVKTYIR